MYKTLEDVEQAKLLISAPGDTLLETIDFKGINQVELAKLMNRPLKTINEIIKGKAEITPQTAIQLERVLGIDADFWISRERNYRLELARIAEAENLLKNGEWVKNFPLSYLKKNHFIDFVKDPLSSMNAILSFFNVANIEAYNNRYYSKVFAVDYKMGGFEKDAYAVTCWLRIGEILSEKIDILYYDPLAFRKSLDSIRSLMVNGNSNFFSQLQSICQDAGVKVIHVPSFNKVNMYGATYWIHDAPVIQLSNLYGTNYKFWETFFHEAAHILLHGKKEVFISGLFHDNSVIYNKIDKLKERQADDFCKNYTITDEQVSELFTNCPEITIHNVERTVMFYASKFRTHPSFIISKLARKNNRLFALGKHFNYIQSVDLSK